MAIIISELVLKLPNDTDFHLATNPCPTLGIPTRDIQEVGPVSAAELTTYPGATASIQVWYYKSNQVFTGNYLVGNRTVAQVITDANT